MSTRTPRKSAAVEPSKSGRTLLLVAIAATLSVLAALWLTYAVIEENSADLGDVRGWILILIVSVVPVCSPLGPYRSASLRPVAVARASPCSHRSAFWS